MHSHTEWLEIDMEHGRVEHKRTFKHHHMNAEPPHTHKYSWVGLSTGQTEIVTWKSKKEEPE